MDSTETVNVFLIILFLQGGMTTRNEMCYAFLLYYPVIDLTWCLSYPTPKQMLEEGILDIYSGNVV